MRYLIALLAITIAALALRTTWTKAEEPPLIEDDPIEVADKAAPLSEVVNPTAAALPEMGGALASTLYGIIHDLVTQQAGMGDREALEARVLATLQELELGNAEAMRAGAKATVDSMLTDASRFMTGAPASVTSVQESAFAAVADKYADKLTRGLAYGGLNASHDGTFVSSSLDVQLPEGVREAPWGVLGGFVWRDGMVLPEPVRALNGQRVGVAGYMMSSGQYEDIHEFLLVESQWSCCFGIPPEVHQVVVVRIPDDEPGVELVNVPLMIMGKLEVGEESEDGWVTSLYRLTAETIEVFE
ncbi:MAG: DUF3299 domain-containing protein [Planctomycetes bacterium]|nr:DUF3299 domain-containing protein [Planctomycetota bacterium]